MVPSWADQILSQLLMEQFDTLPIQSRFIRVREMSGKFKFFQGQGIVREFYVVSVKNGYLLKCQGILLFPVFIK